VTAVLSLSEGPGVVGILRAMTRNARIALVAAALVVAVVAFLIVRPGGDDEPEGSSGKPSAQTETGSGNGGHAAEAQPTEAEAPARPKTTRIQIRGGSVVGGAKTIDVTKGDSVRIIVTSDAPDEIHLHGYDIEREVAPGQPGRFQFKADAEGEFEMESHTAEHAGREPVVARVVVSPS
jgi:FtsP/CotA-like multicopper oxidase with cupredoxin domain